MDYELTRMGNNSYDAKGNIYGQASSDATRIKMKLEQIAELEKGNG